MIIIQQIIIQQEHKTGKQKRLSLKTKAEHVAYMLGRREEGRINVTVYSEIYGVSRQTLYKLEKEFINEFSAQKTGPKVEDKIEEEQNFEYARLLGRTVENLSNQQQERIIRTILQAATSPASSRQVQETVKEAFGVLISKRKIKRIIKEYGHKAKLFLNSIAVEQYTEHAALDEVFPGKKPVLTAVEMDSMAVVACKQEQRRDNEAWGRMLGSFTELKSVVSDQAKGIEKAVEQKAFLSHQFDLFHLKRDINRLLRHLEAQAYKKIDQEYKSQAQLERCKSEETRRKQERVYQTRCEECLKSIELFDEVEKCVKIIYQALEIFDANGNLFDIDKNLKKLDKGADRLEKASKNRKIQNIVKRLRNPKTTQFLTALNENLLSIIIQVQKKVGPLPRRKIIKIIAKQWFYSTHNHFNLKFKEGETKKELLARRKQRCHQNEMRRIANLLEVRILQESLKDFAYVSQQVNQALDQTFRVLPWRKLLTAKFAFCNR